MWEYFCLINWDLYSLGFVIPIWEGTKETENNTDNDIVLTTTKPTDNDYEQSKEGRKSDDAIIRGFDSSVQMHTNHNVAGVHGVYFVFDRSIFVGSLEFHTHLLIVLPTGNNKIDEVRTNGKWIDLDWVFFPMRLALILRLSILSYTNTEHREQPMLQESMVDNDTSSRLGDQGT